MTQFRAVRIVKRGRLHVAVPLEPSEPLDDEIVRATLQEMREHRSLGGGTPPVQPPGRRRSG